MIQTEIDKFAKELIKMNATSEDFKYIPGEYKEVDGKFQLVIEWNNVSDRFISVLNSNRTIMEERKAARRLRGDEILVGDYLRLPDGSESRVTYNWNDRVQDGGGVGSFYINSHGNASYSGGLDMPKPVKNIIDTGEMKTGYFWFFSQGRSGANRAFHFFMEVKVWQLKE